DRALRGLGGAGDAAGAAVRGRARARCGAAGGLHTDERVRSPEDPRPGGGDPGGVLGLRVDRGGPDRLPGGAGRERVAVGAAAGHRARVVGPGGALADAGVSAVPGAGRAARGGRGGGAALRVLPGNCSSIWPPWAARSTSNFTRGGRRTCR